MDVPIDFFISYTGKDKHWAEWIAWMLEEAGYKTMIQAWDFHHASNFVLKMQKGTTDTARTIAVISPDYFESAFTKPEWATAFAEDPTSEKGKLISVRVADFKPPGMFKTIVYIDLVGLEDSVAKKRLIDCIANIVKGTRMKPGAKPSFPGGKFPVTHGAPPPFPGTSPGTKTFLHNLPFSPNPFFTDPHKLLDKLHAALCKKTAAAITQPQAVHGLGGVGKTQLATEYAWTHQADYDVVLWAGTASPSELHANLANLADVLKLPEAEAREQEVKVRAVMDWLRSNQRWLLILDNADTKEAQAAVQDILPAGLRGHIIVTSRRENWPITFGDVKVLMLPKEDARDFLIKRAHKSGFNAGDSKDALKIAVELDGLPLALEQAGAYIAKHHKSFTAYLDLLKKSRARILAEGSAGGTKYPKTVAETWLVSETQLSPTAHAILQVAAFLAPDEIPRALFANGGGTIAEAVKLLAPDKSAETASPLDNAAIDDAVVELSDHSLVELETDAFSCHRLLQAVLLDRLKPDECKQWCRLCVWLLNAYAPRDPSDVRTWPVWNRLQPHVGTLLKNIGDAVNGDFAFLMNQFAVFLLRKALYGEAEPLYRRALAIDEKIYGLEHPTVAIDLNNLAALLQDTNRLTEAELLMRRALALEEKIVGPEHSNLAIRLNNLGQLLMVTKRQMEAEPLMRRALAIDEESCGSEHSNVARDLNNLAQLLQTTSRGNEAEPLMRRALIISEKIYGSEHPNVAICINNLAQFLSATNRRSEAETLMRRALAIDEKCYGPEHPDVAIDLNNLGMLLHNTDRVAEAELLLRRAVGIFIRSLGLEHPKTSMALNIYINILSAMKLSKPEIQAKLQAVTRQ